MKVLVVEDDPKLGALLSRVLSDDSHAPELVTTIAAAKEKLAREHYDAIVLDRMLPDGDGVALATDIRNDGLDTPVLMLTARGETRDRIAGLRAGADDYVVKPFDVEELLARLEAITRRAVHSKWVSGDLEIDRVRTEIRIRGVLVPLTKIEFSLLSRLADEPEKPVSRAELLSSVWHLSFDPGSGLLDVHVSRLREKLGEDAWRVQTARGIGYRLCTKR
jgi:DNA-binding response OmpR family regulator